MSGQTNNHREVIAAVSTLTNQPEYLNSAGGVLDTRNLGAAGTFGEVISSQTPNHREVIAAISTLTGKPEYLTSTDGALNVTNPSGVAPATTITVAPFGSLIAADFVCATATGNQVEINAAIAEANAISLAGSGIAADVELLQGHFTTSASIIPLNNVWLRGQGMFSTRISTNGSFNVIDFTVGATRDNPLRNFTCTDLEVDCSNFSTSSEFKAINGFDYTDCRWQRLYVHDSTATGIGIDFPSRSIIADNLVENCGFKNKSALSAASWSGNVFTYTTASPNSYTASVKATGTLTASGTISDGDTVTLDTLVYTFKTTLTGAAFEVTIAGSVANALGNLVKAVNLTGVAGTDYGTGTVANPKISAGTATSTTIPFTARSFGASENVRGTTTTGANLSFGAATLTGGVNGSAIVITNMVPGNYNGGYTVTRIVSSTIFTIDATNNGGQLNFTVDPGVATTLGFTSDSKIGHNGIGVGVNDNYDESLICTNNICINNQNNNFLVENDGNNPSNDSSYIFSNNVSINGGQAGYRNTGAINTQFNNNYDFSSRTGFYNTEVNFSATVTVASWSAGVATFTTNTVHKCHVGDKITVSGFIPTGWNGYYTVQSVPTTSSLTINITNDPTTALYFGTTQVVTDPVDGSSIIDNVTSGNNFYGVFVAGRSNGLMIKNNTIKSSLNYGIDVTGTSYTQIAGNRIYNCGRQGISLTTSSTEPMQYVDVIDNEVYNNALKYSVDGILISASSGQPCNNINVQGNHSFDTQDTKTQLYGLDIAGTINYVSITDNDFASNLTGGLRLQSTNDTIYISNNMGVNPVGKSALGTTSGSITFDPTLANYFTIKTNGNITGVLPTPVVDGTVLMIAIEQGSSGGTWTSPANAISNGTILLSTTTGVVDVLTWVYSKAKGKWALVSGPLSSTTTFVAPRVTTLSSVSATYTPNVSTTDVGLIVNPGANFTVANPTGTPVDGQYLTVRVYSNATGRTPTWGAAYTSGPLAVLLTTALANNSTINFVFVYDASSSTYVLIDPMLAITPTSITASGAITASNLSGTNTGDQTNISGNAATVTTNANLTGPITSVGNATSIAAQTGTGSTFVVATSPTITTPKIAQVNDANGNPYLTVNATASAIGGIAITNNISGATVTLANGNTGNSPTLIKGAGTGVVAVRPATNSTGAIALQNSGGTAIMSVDSTNSRIAIGPSASTPTSVLDLTASTTGNASLRLRSGTAPTSPNAGDVWNDGTNLVLSSMGLNLNNAGGKINITTGSNASAGTATLTAGTVTVSTTVVTANSLIFLTDTASILTNVGTLSVSSKSAGTSFTVTSANVLDTSTFNWLIIN